MSRAHDLGGLLFSMTSLHRPSGRDDFEIAIICALPLERNAVEALLDDEYEVDGFSYGKAFGRF